MDAPDTSLTASEVAWMFQWHGEPYATMNALYGQYFPEGCPEITPDTPAHSVELSPDECRELTRNMEQRFAPRHKTLPVVIVEHQGRWLIDGRNRCCVAYRDGMTIRGIVLCPA